MTDTPRLWMRHEVRPNVFFGHVYKGQGGRLGSPLQPLPKESLDAAARRPAATGHHRHRQPALE